MGKELIYLDYAATAPLAETAKTAMADGFALVGNPSSVHRAGRAARDAISKVREQLAAALGTTPGQVVFTSGGTEANALALTQVPQSKRYVSAIEHEAVLSWTLPAYHLPVTAHGIIDLEGAQARLSSWEPGLVSLMLVNNATGIIQPVTALAEIAHAHGHLVHCDGVQAFGKVPIDIATLGADFLTVSAHKIGGPKGIGALIVKDGFALTALLQGGGQERRRRPGTENVLGILGFGGALEAIGDYAGSAHYDALQASIETHVGAAHVAGSASSRVPHILSVRMAGVKNQLQLMRFDLAGLCVSAGSACSSGKVAGNHVLEVMGLGESAEEYIRLSFGPSTTSRHIAQFLSVWDDIRASQKAAA
ncbi:MAG: cysteine desulfurase family protein [Pseudomonadota bacterium]